MPRKSSRPPLTAVFDVTPEEDERAMRALTAYRADGIFRLASEIEGLTAGDADDSADPREYVDRVSAVVRLAGGTLEDQRGCADALAPGYPNTAKLWRAFIERAPERCLEIASQGPFVK